MLKTKYKPSPVLYGVRRKSRCIPDQSMTIKEIVSRYVRGIPVDVVKREPVYVDQNEHDLEALSRMDFGEKAELAERMRADGEAFQARLQEARTKASEADAKAKAGAKSEAPASPA